MAYGRSFILCACAVALTACAPAGDAPVVDSAQGPVRDLHSFSNPASVVVRHLALDVDVRFESRTIEGRASLTIDNLDGAGKLRLDTRDLDIRAVTLGADQQATSFELADPQPFLGRALEIDILPDTTLVHVDYSSRPEAAALQWLEPRQTAAGRHPFLLSQSQAALARTWIPCQDTPGVRFTYEATVRVPPGLLALMSAENPMERSPDGVYTFSMPQPIPSYLLALAVGEIAFRPLGERTGIYAEPPLLESAAWEFADTPKMMRAAEELYGPYRWGRYDLIVLPPSFPFGGMENPRLTFATPTVLAGDRSLVSLIAHELAHSWSGNLVTNATWDDFWLNEGFTVYFEYRIMEALYGRDYVEMLAKLGRDALIDEMTRLDPRDSWLKLDLEGRDPDDSGTDVAYEKGYLLLRLLEERFGRDRWDPFLRDYFERFAFQSMTTEGFLAHLRRELIDDDPDADALEAGLRIDEWVYGPGLPPNAPAIESDAFAQVEAQLRDWNQSGVLPQAADWTSHEWVHFVRRMPRSVTPAQLAALDDAFELSASGNSEILHAWLLQGLARDYPPAYPAAERFLTSMGRAKFLVPLYRQLAAAPDGGARARDLYRRARPGYHPVAVSQLDEILVPTE